MMKKQTFFLMLLFVWFTAGYAQCPVTVTANNPWNYGFDDNGTTLNPCWTNERIATGATDWVVATAATGTPATTPDGSAFKARYARTVATGTHEGRLISPKLDISGLTQPKLRFSHARQNGTTLQAFYRTSATGAWQQLSPQFQYAQLNWRKRCMNFQILRQITIFRLWEGQQLTI